MLVLPILNFFSLSSHFLNKCELFPKLVFLPCMLVEHSQKCVFLTRHEGGKLPYVTVCSHRLDDDKKALLQNMPQSG